MSIATSTSDADPFKSGHLEIPRADQVTRPSPVAAASAVRSSTTKPQEAARPLVFEEEVRRPEGQALVIRGDGTKSCEVAKFLAKGGEAMVHELTPSGQAPTRTNAGGSVAITFGAGNEAQGHAQKVREVYGRLARVAGVNPMAVYGAVSVTIQGGIPRHGVEAEKIAGVTILNLARMGAPDADRLKALRGMGTAIQAIQKEGLRHNDISPSNFMVDKTGVRTIDLGAISPTSEVGGVPGAPHYMGKDITKIVGTIQRGERVLNAGEMQEWMKRERTQPAAYALSSMDVLTSGTALESEWTKARTTTPATGVKVLQQTFRAIEQRNGLMPHALAKEQEVMTRGIMGEATVPEITQSIGKMQAAIVAKQMEGRSGGPVLDRTLKNGHVNSAFR